MILDDYGMILVKAFYEAYDDLEASAWQVPEWRALNFWEDDRKVSVFRNDLRPRLDACILSATDFIAHFYLLLSQPDVRCVRHLKWHLCIDQYADLKIQRTRTDLAKWQDIRVIYVLMRELVAALKQCSHERRRAIPAQIAVLM